jgi:type II secretory pathway pseudopilin PulG
MRLIQNKKMSAFTLVEILLYISIVSVMMGVISIFMFSILQSQAKFKTISEVDQQGIQVAQIISQAIRNSNGITAPIQGNSGSSLTLGFADSAKNPTVFNSNGNNLQIKEGTDAIIPLTNSKVSISGLSFSNLSLTNTPGTVKFQFTISYINLSGRNEYDYSKTFYGSAGLRFN